MYSNMPSLSGNFHKLILVVLLFSLFIGGHLGYSTADAQASDVVLSSETAAIDSGAEQPEVSLAEETRQAEHQASNQAEQIYLPLFTNQPKLATRMGYGITWPRRGGSINDILTFENAPLLKGGWYLNWGVSEVAPTPDGIEFAQMIRVHQSLDCTDDNGNQRWIYVFRDTCPYTLPLDDSTAYRYTPDSETLAQVAAARPGSIWLVGNEIEREDWSSNCNDWRDRTEEERVGCSHQGQDEILPETYALAYHEIYNILKEADPTAQVTIGGVIQITPLRIQYLTAIYDAYLEAYGVPIPVDMWNIHAFVFTEHPLGGAGIPVGITPETDGLYRGAPINHINFSLIEEQIYRMRQWMKDRGEQEKGLIISEYGVVYDNGTMRLNENDPTPVVNFMLESFDFFLNEKDCELGFTEDDCRLVQRWNWFSLDGRRQSATAHGPLYNTETDELTPAGEAWRTFVQENHADLYME